MSPHAPHAPHHHHPASYLTPHTSQLNHASIACRAPRTLRAIGDGLRPTDDELDVVQLISNEVAGALISRPRCPSPRRHSLSADTPASASLSSTLRSSPGSPICALNCPELPWSRGRAGQLWEGYAARRADEAPWEMGACNLGYNLERQFHGAIDDSTRQAQRIHFTHVSTGHAGQARFLL
ncbi:hypothetical protein K504DRAFT_10976 [Pleomassaria siparia CBS 279.74]|uniref:Uncharacterized protein n=1 Tax=Pleomassaria siparia CBS 279.74 TaxID=1314801 RepID=A0A6G1KPM2_9PLEO|nr:hypothetical protein K504DRAFT_10976 [Pleomassaria siparia CBS 279.74]